MATIQQYAHGQVPGRCQPPRANTCRRCLGTATRPHALRDARFGGAGALVPRQLRASARGYIATNPRRRKRELERPIPHCPLGQRP